MTDSEDNIIEHIQKWDVGTRYNVAHEDMIQQRATMMQFLLREYGIEAVEKFFLNQNPAWAENLKVGKIKKVIVKALSKLAPRQIMNRVAEMIIEQAQYLVDLDNIESVPTDNNNMLMIKVSKCPVRKEFKKTIKKLDFNNMSEGYICTFACVPVLRQYCSVGNVSLSHEYNEEFKGCYLKLFLEKRIGEELIEESTVEPATAENGGTK